MAGNGVRSPHLVKSGVYYVRNIEKIWIARTPTGERDLMQYPTCIILASYLLALHVYVCRYFTETATEAGGELRTCIHSLESLANGKRPGNMILGLIPIPCIFPRVLELTLSRLANLVSQKFGCHGVIPARGGPKVAAPLKIAWPSIIQFHERTLNFPGPWLMSGTCSSLKLQVRSRCLPTMWLFKL